MKMNVTRILGHEPAELSRRIRTDRGAGMQRRRGIGIASLLGIGSMAIVSLFQSGVIRHLPDPRRGNFHSDKVNSSEEAYSYGGPDGPITIAAHAANLVLATTGGPDRAERHPWLPLVASAAAAAQAAVAAKYLFYQMPKVDKAWCPYCIFDAFMHFATFALTLPEAKSALQSAVR
jgi:uncharacterized membrane protein